MNFFRKLSPCETNMASDSTENNNMMTTGETSIDHSHPEIDDYSNNPVTESNIMVNTDEDDIANNMCSSVVCINEFGVTKTLRYLGNVIPIEMIPTDNTTCKEIEDIAISSNDNIGPEDILIVPAVATPVHVTEDKPEINNNNKYDLKETNIPNDASTLKDVIDDETIQNVKEFEEALNSIDETTLTDDSRTELINLDEFLEIIDELNPLNEEPITINNDIETDILIVPAIATPANATKDEPEINNNDITNNKNSSVVYINECGVTKTFCYLGNVIPIEMIANDKTACKKIEDNAISSNDNIGPEDILIVPAVATPVHVTEDKPEINNNNKHDLKETNIPNDASTLKDVIDDETVQSVKEFEEALKSIDETTLTDDFRTELTNLDEFLEIIDELDPLNEEPITINNDSDNNENASFCKEVTDTNNEILQLNINENIDVISISSTEDAITQTDEIKDSIPISADSVESDSDDGYNSSDFEFISETEANLTGFIINYGVDNFRNLSPASSEPLIYYCGRNFDTEADEESDPGEGPSRQERPRNEFEDRSYRNNHNIPEGDDYLGLFQGIYNPLLPMSEIYFLENKSVRTSAMNSQYDGIGFDKQLALRRHQPDSSEDEFEEEAKESAKKILSMYPGQNRKRRRRYL